MNPNPKSNKRKKTSGLSGADLVIAIEAIKNLIKMEEEAAKLVEEAEKAEVAEQTEEVDDEVPLTLHTILDMLTKRLGGPQTYSFSSINEERLDKLHIFFAGTLRLKADYQSRVAKTDSIGEDQDWSADRLHRHLSFLERLVPRTNEAAARLWINAFFFRVAVMLSGTSTFVLAVEPNVLPVRVDSNSVLSGFIDFTAISTTAEHAEYLLQNNRLTKSPGQAMFVTEAKGSDQRLASHIPQAVSELYACAKHLEKTIIRGALTNGREWIFFLLRCHEGGGAQYFQSTSINLMTIVNEVSRESSCLIAAIIADWTLHSHEDIADNDYFTLPSSPQLVL